MLGNIGAVELLLIMLVILLVFGAKRIPEIARGLGRGIREFREAASEIKSELRLDESRSTYRRPVPPARMDVTQPTVSDAGPVGAGANHPATPDAANAGA